MRIFILSGISGTQVVYHFENENLHSVGNIRGLVCIYHFENGNLHSVGTIRRLGVCQSTGEAKMRIFIQAFGSEGWVYANLLGFLRMRIFILLTVSGAWEYTNLLRF